MPYTNKIWRRFGAAKTNAKRRNIAFEFSFDEWCKWWKDNLGPKWFSLRGKGGHKYVMARKGDCGPYSARNVLCVTGRSNRRQQDENGRVAKGSNHYCAKLTPEQVNEARRLYVKYSKDKNLNTLAVKYGVNSRVMGKVLRNETWRSLLGVHAPDAVMNQGDR